MTTTRHSKVTPEQFCDPAIQARYEQQHGSAHVIFTSNQRPHCDTEKLNLLFRGWREAINDHDTLLAKLCKETLSSVLGSEYPIIDALEHTLPEE